MSSARHGRLLLAGVLALPLVVLGYSWAATYMMARQGQEWLIPIRGYDPRDMLRGHYVRYQYDWPWESEALGEDGAAPFPMGELCIQGRAPQVARVRQLPFGSPGSDRRRDCAAVVRATAGARQESRGLDGGILYASQPRALALSHQLADPRLRGFVRVKIRPDGVVRALDLEFKPRTSR